MNKKFIIDWIDTKVGKVPKVSTNLSKRDKWNAFLVRLTINRMNYKVDPGIYAVGNPNSNSLVFVSANYKLSFDILRKELNGLDAWIIVLDTRGINVWCAAGKGTFGTKELVNRIEVTGLKKILNHRKLIAPQLGATGVSAYKVKKLSGFKVIFGPVRAPDIPTFLDAGMKATPEMRQVRFTFLDRLKLVPIEVIQGARYLFFIIVIFILLSGLNKNGYSFSLVKNRGIGSTINLLFAYLAGAVVGPLLLPYLPGRSFSLKGFFAGLIFFIISLLINFARYNSFEILAWLFIISAISSFLTMNFTGASTYTSLSGVKKEMRYAVPLQIESAIVGIILWITGRFV